MSDLTYRVRISLGDPILAASCAWFAYQREFWPFVVSLVVTMFFWKTSVRRIKDGESHE